MSRNWLRFKDGESTGFGFLEGEYVRVCEGNMFDNAIATDKMRLTSDLRLLMPATPTKIIALWNNFTALGDKLGLQAPDEPLYLLKSPNSWLNPGETIRSPGQPGKIVFEGELGIVIGTTASSVHESRAMEHVFGYTCANDVTHADILNRDGSFAQWVRAKGFDTFCPFGPSIATGLDPEKLMVKTILNGVVRQEYPVSDMRVSVANLVSRISADMTLYPGDIILCGTSVGVGSMKPGSTVEVEIEGIGKLVNRFE